MRIATWNIQKGLDDNWPVLESLGADVMTVQECGEQTAAQAADLDGWACEWQPGGWEKGLAVLTRQPYHIEAREEQDSSAVSVIIGGSHRFRFVGFWAMTESHAGSSYPRQGTRLIERLPIDDIPTVVAGDFNASRSAPHLANVERLRERGLVSSYHSFYSVPHSGTEDHPTSYFQWDRDRPYHMDFVFVPASWTIGSVDVGGFDEYPGRGLSDHVPVVVTVSPA
jgi:exodeoxyribonuclease-3